MRFRLLLFCLLVILLGCESDSEIKNASSDYVLHQIEEQIYYYPHLIEKQIDSLETLLSTDDSHPHVGQMAYLCGFMAYHKGEMDSAIVHMERALTDLAKQEDTKGQAKCHLVLGWITEGSGFWEQAKSSYNKTIRLLGSSNCKEIGLAYLGIARCNKVLKESFQMEYEEGILCLKTTGKREFMLYADFSSFLFKDKHAVTETHLKELAREYLDLGLTNNAATVYKVLASHYVNSGRLDSAHTFVDQAMEICDKKFMQSSIVPGLMQLKGVLFFKEKDYERARYVLKKSIKISDKNKKKSQNYYCYKYLYRIDTLQGKWQSAIHYQTKAYDCLMMTRRKEKQLMAKITEVDASVLLMQQAIEKLKYDKKKYGILFVSCLIFIFMVVIVILQFVRERYRKKQQKHEERASYLQNLLMGLGEKRLLQQRLSQGGDLLEESAGLSGVLSSDFENCYMETIQHFSSHFKQLSKTDIRYAVLFALSLSDDIIAEIQNVQIVTLRKVKQRIRQKVGLEKDQPLASYFKDFLQAGVINSALLIGVLDV